jgi:hypothetical protein
MERRRHPRCRANVDSGKLLLPAREAEAWDGVSGMVRAIVFSVIAIIVSTGAARSDDRVDIARLAATWPDHFLVSGTKTEPTYIEGVTLARDGNIFTLWGGAPVGMPASRQRLAVGDGGQLTVIACPASLSCRQPLRPSGFLASAAILAAARRGALHGRFTARRFGPYRVVCVPAEQIGIAQPLLDPCVEIHSGAVIALRHRLSHKFEGPSLDPWSVEFTTDALAAN